MGIAVSALLGIGTACSGPAPVAPTREPIQTSVVVATVPAAAEVPTEVATEVAVPLTPAPTMAVTPAPTLAVGPDQPALPNPNTVAVPRAGACHSVDGLPDRTCTPGLLNPRLTPAQLCALGFSTRTIRPPASYTDELKKRLMASYGETGINPTDGRPWSTGDVELDHLVSLEDLGHPWSPQNLWPEPRRSTGSEPNAEEKDQVETTVHELICSDQAHAADYAARLAADWTQFRRSAAPQPQTVKAPEP